MKNSVNALITGLRDAATQAINQMLSDMGVDNIIDKLNNLPEQIKQQEEYLLTARRNLEGIQGEMNLLKQVTMAQVAEELNDNGKAKFSNENARSAETTVRLVANELYQAYKAECQKADDAVNSAQFELSRLNNELGAAKVIGQVLAAKMNLLAGL